MAEEHQKPAATAGKKCASPAARQRLDLVLVSRSLVESRAKAQALILAGDVRVDGQVELRPGRQVLTATDITLEAQPRFVSRGGDKLDHALTMFGIDPTGCICLDVGASSGGFTDCLLQRDARRVFAVDVGYGQLSWTIRQDTRVVALERTNIRFLESLPEPIDLAVIDVSFIGLSLVLPVVRRLVQPTGQAVALVKPQFEAGRGHVGRGGVVRDPGVHRQVLEAFVVSAEQSGFAVRGLTPSPLRGPAGNVEFLAWLVAPEGVPLVTTLVQACLDAVASG